ncbi:MAG: glycosyltransferase family 2 protein [Acidimicrobiales bacterium]
MTVVDPALVALCIPTLNPGRWIDRLVPALAEQRLRPGTILVVDSASTDGSLGRFGAVGAEIISIARDRFDHGGTRNIVLDHVDADVIVYLTQDAVPADEDALGALVEGLLGDPRTGVAYGRQLPHPDAGALARAHRAFNYPEQPEYRTAEDVSPLGVRAAFSSNSFAAYRREALEDIGRFPAPIVGSEDRWAAARLLQHGWGITYVAGAQVEHSHDYTLAQDFRRYFDIGAFQASEPWFEAYLGRPEPEGARLARRQVEWLRQAGVRLPLLRVIAHAGTSWLGFQAGRFHRRLPPGLAARWSTAPAYFANQRRSGRA